MWEAFKGICMALGFGTFWPSYSSYYASSCRSVTMLGRRWSVFCGGLCFAAVAYWIVARFRRKRKGLPQD